MVGGKFFEFGVIFAFLTFWFLYTESRSERVILSKNGCTVQLFSIKNGYTRFDKGLRIVKFFCKINYKLVGKPFSICVNGRWKYPFPICVATGCNILSPPFHGSLLEMHDGALVRYECDPGYILRGSATHYCDGRKWNGSIPTCEVAMKRPAESCDFESFFICGWSHDPTAKFDWRRHQFATPSGHSDTGPYHDHTLGPDKPGHYMYIEASAPRRANDTARLYSPVYFPHLSPSCFTLWYHMYGRAIGSLRVYIKTDTEDLASLQPVWQRDGEQGNVWLQAAIQIHSLHDDFQIIIEGVTGLGFEGDAAVDDVNLRLGNCSESETSLEVSTLYTSVNLTSIATLPAFSDVNDTPSNESLFTSDVKESISKRPIENSVITDSQPTFTEMSTHTSRLLTSSVMELRNDSKRTLYPRSRTRWWRESDKPKPLASVSEKSSARHIALGVGIATVVLISSFAISIFFWRSKQKKLIDDSDMRYLPDNEVVEYSENQTNPEYFT